MCRSRRCFGEVGGGDVVEVEEVLSEGLRCGGGCDGGGRWASGFCTF